MVYLAPDLAHCAEVRFASFLSGGFITAIVVNPPERKLVKRTSVQFRLITMFLYLNAISNSAFQAFFELIET